MNRIFYQQGKPVLQTRDADWLRVMRCKSLAVAQIDQKERKLLGSDAMGTPIRVAQAGGGVNKSFTVYGFSELERGNAVIGYCGYWYDGEIGAYPLGNGRRCFFPVLPRFSSSDRLSPFGSGGINAYAYCAGDPLNFSDPSGMNKIPNDPKSLRQLAFDAVPKVHNEYFGYTFPGIKSMGDARIAAEAGGVKLYTGAQFRSIVEPHQEAAVKYMIGKTLQDKKTGYLRHASTLAFL